MFCCYVAIFHVINKQLESGENSTMIEASLVKVSRAKRHIRELEDSLDSFLNKRPFRTFIGPHKRPGKRLISVKQIHSIPVGFSAIIGDAVHNLRSALDLLIYALVGTKNERAQFPFSEKGEAAFEKLLQKNSIGQAGSRVENIVRGLKPYKGGNETLYGLHRLDIVDKHRLLLVSGATVDLKVVDARKLDPMLSQFTGPGVLRFNGLSGGIMFNLPTQGRNRQERRAYKTREVETEFQPEFSICFGANLPFEGQLVVPTLWEITKEVEKIIDQINKVTNGAA